MLTKIIENITLGPPVKETNTAFLHTGEYAGKRVFCKIPNYGSVENPSDVDASFMSEALMLERIGPHPNIVEYFGACDLPNQTTALVFEYLDGHTLAEKIGGANKKGRRLPFSDVHSIIDQVAQGLNYVHSKGVVHRDTTPFNMMQLENGTAKLLDFGLAKQGNGECAVHTRRPSGTPDYCSAEVWRDFMYSPQTDLWALSVSAWEALTGDVPYPIQRNKAPALETIYSTELKLPNLSLSRARQKAVDSFFAYALSPTLGYADTAKFLADWRKLAE